MGEDYYELLGVPRDATGAEITAAYRARLKETHPDVSDASNAGKQTKRLIEAKEVLTDETERARYDRLGHDRYLGRERSKTTTSADSSAPPSSGGRENGTTPGAAGRDTDEGEQTDDRTTQRDSWRVGGSRSRQTGGVDREGVSQTVGGRTTGRAAGSRSDRSGTAGSSDGPAGTSGPDGQTDGGTGTVGSGGAAAGMTGGERATTGRREDRRVGWYTEGDPSGTTREAWSVGGTDSRDLWGRWRPASGGENRYGAEGVPSNRVLSRAQMVGLLGLTLFAYPLVLTSVAFPLLPSAVRLLLAVGLVFVVALLIVLPRLGVPVFGAWTVLFPLVFLTLGIPVFDPASVVVTGGTVLSFGFAVLSRLLTRPPVL